MCVGTQIESIGRVGVMSYNLAAAAPATDFSLLRGRFMKFSYVLASPGWCDVSPGASLLGTITAKMAVVTVDNCRNLFSTSPCG